MTTGIEWTDETWNPTVGCTHVSKGCDGCYAAREAHGRLSGHPLYAGLAERRQPGNLIKFTGEVRLVPERLDQPIRWKRPRRIFVNSMSDVFHPGVPDDFIAEIFATMAAAPRHSFQVLTKRPNRMAALTASADFEKLVFEKLNRLADERRIDHFMWLPVWPLSNVWLGTSIEDERALYRLDHLRQTNAAVKFLSIEPLLGPLPDDTSLAGVDWVIVGGESGPNARPMPPEWVRPIRDRCVEADLPFLFKQWGEWSPEPPTYVPAGLIVDQLDGGTTMYRVGKKAAGRELDGRKWDQYPDA